MLCFAVSAARPYCHRQAGQMLVAQVQQLEKELKSEAEDVKVGRVELDKYRDGAFRLEVSTGLQSLRMKPH